MIREVETITESACGLASIKQFGEIEIQSGRGSRIITPTIGNVMKFSVETFKEVDLELSADTVVGDE